MKTIQILFLFAALLAAAAIVFLLLPKPGELPVLFFAYGANAEIGAITSRAGGFGNSTAATLIGYRLVFQTNKHSEFGVANLEPEPSSHVAGALYTLTPAQMGLLDKSSGGIYEKIDVLVETEDGKTLSAYTYALKGETAYAPPSQVYMVAASKGLKEFGFPESEQQALVAAAAEAQLKSGRGA